ncbi:solute:sodium symporter family transporter [Paraburkholderia phosphatilytica]|uniref:solute:sodium symporter family transporter n=1 Tax=Paraburkholderia phosphatilytica TaxID=2282883 RepID=UPI000E4DFD5C|nr:solute:sodium symporter family transporter [Paraburkholderia phosphatilytica]
MITFLTFIVLTSLVAFISFRMTKDAGDRGAKGYFMAGNGLGGWFIAGSMMLTNLSLEQLVGLNGDSYTHNLSGMAWEVTAVIAIVAMATFFLPRFLRGGFSTLPQFLEARYDEQTRKMVSLIFIVYYTFILNPSGLYLAAITFDHIFHVQQVLGLSYPVTLAILVWAAGICGGLYAVFGGLRAVAVSDTINGVILLAAGLLVPVLGLFALGHGHLSTGIHVIATQAPQKLNAIGSSHDSTPFSTVFTGMVLANLFYFCTNQAIIQRAFAAKNLAEGQKGVLIAGGFKLLGPLTLLLPGVIAYHMFAQHPLARGDFAYPMLVEQVMPWWAKGFFVAALFGAVLSHFNSIVNSTATLLAYDFVKARRPNIDDASLVRIGKGVSIVIAVISLIIAPMLMYAPDGIYILIRRFSGFMNIPIIAIVLYGFFDRRGGALPAKLVLIGHIIAYGVLVFVINIEKLLGINFIHIMAILFAAEILLMFSLRGVFSRETPYEPARREGYDMTPWRHAPTMSIILLAILVTMYLVFSPLGLAASGPASGNLIYMIAAVWIVAAVLIRAFRRREKSMLVRSGGVQQG